MPAGIPAFLARFAEPPLLVGPSFGGLFVQLLMDRGLGAAGIVIDGAPPRGVLPGPNTVEPGMVRANYRRHQRATAPVELREFPGRSHWLIAEPGWETVADAAIEWTQEAPSSCSPDELRVYVLRSRTISGPSSSSTTRVTSVNPSFAASASDGALVGLTDTMKREVDRARAQAIMPRIASSANP